LSDVNGISPAIGQQLSVEQAMRFALREGLRGTGRVAPNPLVGCVVLDRDHRFLVSGYHAQLGGDHAEAAALRKLNDASCIAGAHVFVTLEPCAHQGRTPSCARTLASLKPASVTYAVEDPNPLVAGKGADILSAAGVVARKLDELTELSTETRRDLVGAAEDLAEIFLHNYRTDDPFVAVKVAATLDGQMAFNSGESKWITGEVARLHAHSVRARYDAVAVGMNTVMIDNPSLDIRHPEFVGFENRVIVFDPQGRVLSSLAGKNLLKVRSPKQIITVVGNRMKYDNPCGATVLEVELHNRQFDIKQALVALKGIGIASLMVEGGAGTIGAFFAARKVQRLHLYQAPVVFGGQHALAWSSGFGVADLGGKFRFTRFSWQSVGDDLYLTGRL
jgi:diaminohydroxyphosphoribosylaminopyrimidine deaminase/5-amino-6-(5-phosphoribosylamino)uracil reductase